MVAVITGDIVASSQLGKEGRKQLFNQLDVIGNDMQRHIGGIRSEIFRGDSIQILVKQPERALKAAMLMRTGLKRGLYQHQNSYPIDIRLAIGVGEIGYEGESLGTSDGEAFQLSGRALDQMKRRESLKINTPWPEINQEMALACALSEAITGRWSAAQAEIIYAYLLQQKTQQELAKEFGISQGAVSQRMSESGYIDAIKLFIQRFEQIIKAKQ